MSSKPEYRITALKISDFKGIRVFEADFDDEGGLVLIGGRNHQGKSSTLDAIESTFRGKRSHPDDPVRHGAERAETIIECGRIRIRKRIKPDKSFTLKVTDMASGRDASKKQDVLDGLYETIAFDPLAFATMSEQERLGLLIDLSGVDVDTLDAAISEAELARRDANRDLLREKTLFEAMPEHDEVGTDPIDTVALVDRLQAAQTENGVISEKRADAAYHRNEAELHEGEAAEMEDEATKLEARAAHLRADAAKAHELAKSEREKGAAIEATIDREPTDLQPLMDEIASAERTNGLVSDNRAKEAAREAIVALHDAADEKSDRVEEARAAKRKAIRESDLRIPGLSFGPSGVTYEDVPFEQLSDSERWRISIAMGCALNPDLRVMLVRQGSLLDREAISALREVAKAERMQIFVEIVDEDAEDAIIIEDGEIAEDRRERHDGDR